MSNMMGFVFLVVLGLAFAIIWVNLARRPHPEAKIGPDGTDVREPETFVVHHEGKGQGIDIANTALKERTEELRRDLPGDQHKIKTPIPGREMTRLSEPPSDISRYGDEKVAPGATPGQPGAETKEKVLTEGPKGSRPETPEEPGSPYQMGRRVTDIRRDVELSAEILPSVDPDRPKRLDRDLAASPSTNGQEPGYGLGQTEPGGSDGEGGNGDRNEGGHPRRGEQRGSGDLGGMSPDPHHPDSPPPAGALYPGTGKVIPLYPGGTDLPSAVPDDDEVVAMVRNPRSLYIYWEVGRASEHVRRMLGEEEWQRSVPCLRIFDVTDRAGSAQTIDLGPQEDHHFLDQDLEPGRTYVVSYERRGTDGRLYLLSHSAPVHLPQDGPAVASPLARIFGAHPATSAGSPWR